MGTVTYRDLRASLERTILIKLIIYHMLRRASQHLRRCVLAAFLHA